MDTGKKRWFLLLFVAALLCCAGRTNVFAAEGTEENGPFTFELLADGTMEVSRCERDVSGEVIIPDMVDGKKVTSIGSSAFYYCKMKAVTIPEGVTKISQEAFSCCKQLEQVIFPKSIVSIESSAFSSCIKLRTVTIPEGITEIPRGAFSSCWRLEQVVFPESVVSIGRSAFERCTSLRAVAFPSALKTIRDRAFLYTSLEQVEIPAETIGKEAFSDCKNLERVNILKNVKIIEDYVFSGCESLISVSLPSDIKEIGSGAFSHCYSLEGIELPSGVEKIGDYAFRSCKSLKSIEIPSGAKTIGRESFFSCGKLSKVTFPSSVTAIGASAFSGCKILKNIELPSGLKELGCTEYNEGYAFADTGLTSIVIPENVEKIGVDCFSNTKMKTITIYSKKLNNQNSFAAFSNLNSTKLTLKVPASKLKDYKDFFGKSSSDFTLGTRVRFVVL